jgi:transposase
MLETLNKRDGRLDFGLDLGDRSSFYCVLHGTGDVLMEQKVSTTPKAINEIFGAGLVRIAKGATWMNLPLLLDW